jgi:hypothetical protein
VKENNMRLASLSLAAAATLLAACSSSTTETSVVHPNTPAVDHPEWVTRGSGALAGDKQVLFGVASSTGIRNPTLARTTADNRARDEISKLMEVYSASLMKDYQASTTAGDFSATSEEQHVESAIKTFASNTLNGVEVVDHWIHPVDGTIYSLATLDLAGFADQLAGAGELNEKTKERVKRAAAKAFADLEAEEAKHADQ